MITNCRMGASLLFITVLAATNSASPGLAAEAAYKELIESVASQDANAWGSHSRLWGVIRGGGDDAKGAQTHVVQRLLADLDNEHLKKELLRIRETEPLHAAALALEVFNARLWAKSKNLKICAGQVVVEDDRIDATACQGQSMVQEGGYFATSVGDPTKPIGFSLHGYRPVFAKVEPEQGRLSWVGRLHLRRDNAKVKRTLEAKLEILGDINPDEVSTSLHLAPPIINAGRGGGFAGMARDRGEPLPEVSVSKTGEIHASGFSPTLYWLYLTADGYSTRELVLDFVEQDKLEVGVIPFLCADIGYYAKAEAPKSQPIEWEESYEQAAQRSRREHRPLFVMFSTDPCTPCINLERTTLKNPWIEQLMSPFVAVKVMENRKLQEDIFGQGIGYPTLAFVGPEGELAHHLTGFRESMFFAQECTKVYEKLNIEIPLRIQRLLDVFEQADEIAQQPTQGPE